jgi:hypothetical protein
MGAPNACRYNPFPHAQLEGIARAVFKRDFSGLAAQIGTVSKAIDEIESNLE